MTAAKVYCLSVCLSVNPRYPSGTFGISGCGAGALRRSLSGDGRHYTSAYMCLVGVGRCPPPLDGSEPLWRAGIGSALRPLHEGPGDGGLCNGSDLRALPQHRQRRSVNQLGIRLRQLRERFDHDRGRSAEPTTRPVANSPVSMRMAESPAPFKSAFAALSRTIARLRRNLPCSASRDIAGPAR